MKLPGLKVLVAEDNKVNQEIVSLYLRKLGCEFDIAANGQEILEKHAVTSYDVILMDAHMPVMDGFEAARAIREKEGYNMHTVIIALLPVH
ncbi:MAG: response regulator [Bacillota bacterium]